MRSASKLLPLLVALAVATSLAACGDDGGTTASTTAVEATKHNEVTETDVPTIVIRDGEPAGGIAELEYNAGDEIRFRVSSDAADEVHVHGYDVSKDIPAGGTATLAFPAEIEGIFEVELEELGVQIAELRVNP